MLTHCSREGAELFSSGNLSPMKLTRLGLLAVAAAGMTLLAQEDAEFVDWMKQCNTANGVLRKLEQKTTPEAVGNSERIAGIYEKMIGFWRQKNAADAVKWSEEGKAAALQLRTRPRLHSESLAAPARAAMMRTGKSCLTGSTGLSRGGASITHAQVASLPNRSHANVGRMPSSGAFGSGRGRSARTGGSRNQH
jgi:hypothetical protein